MKHFQRFQECRYSHISSPQNKHEPHIDAPFTHSRFAIIFRISFYMLWCCILPAFIYCGPFAVELNMIFHNEFVVSFILDSSHLSFCANESLRHFVQLVSSLWMKQIHRNSFGLRSSSSHKMKIFNANNIIVQHSNRPIVFDSLHDGVKCVHVKISLQFNIVTQFHMNDLAAEQFHIVSVVCHAHANRLQQFQPKSFAICVRQHIPYTIYVRYTQRIVLWSDG